MIVGVARLDVDLQALIDRDALLAIAAGHAPQDDAAQAVRLRRVLRRDWHALTQGADLEEEGLIDVGGLGDIVLHLAHLELARAQLAFEKLLAGIAAGGKEQEEEKEKPAPCHGSSSSPSRRHLVSRERKRRKRPEHVAAALRSLTLPARRPTGSRRPSA